MICENVGPSGSAGDSGSSPASSGAAATVAPSPEGGAQKLLCPVGFCCTGVATAVDLPDTEALAICC